MTPLSTKAFIGAAAIACLALASAPAYAHYETSNGLEANNALNQNALNQNALNQNGLANNALNENSLESTNGYEAGNTASARGLPTAAPTTIRLSFGGLHGAQVKQIELLR